MSVGDRREQRLQEALREARRDGRLTQVQLATKLKKPQSFVSKYEQGERTLTFVEVLRVLEALKIDPGEFIRALNHPKE